MFLKHLATQLRLIFRHAKPGRAWAGASLLLLILGQAIAELVLTGTVSLLGVAMASPESLGRFTWLHRMLALFPLAKHHASQPSGMLTIVLLLVVIGSVVKNALTAVTTYFQTRYGQAVAADLGHSLFRAYLSSPYLWHLSQNTAELSTTLNYRANVALYIGAVQRLLTQLVIGVFLLTGALAFTTQAAAIVIGLSSICAVLVYRFARTRVSLLGKNGVRLNKGAARTGLAGLQGIREVQIYRQQEAFIEHYARQVTEFGINQAKVQTFQPLPMWALEPVGMCTLLGALVYMLHVDTPIGRLTGTLTLLAAVAWRLLPCLNKTVAELISLHAQQNYVDTFLQRLREMPPSRAHSSLQAPPFGRSFRMHDVWFRYPGATVDALHAIDLEIPKGKMIGIIGPSGAGKSTLIGVLTGLLVPTAGKLTVDGVHLDAANLDAWSHQIGYVPQSPYLLDASLAENIAFSQWGKPIDRDRVHQCCRLAAMDFLGQLPDGIDTLVGERGMRLSGGQVQRVAIARALYCQPEIIVFDEATSALDTGTEEAIQHTVTTLRETMTLVIIAHRLTTVEQCDTVYWIENGTIRDHGSPTDILPAYACGRQTSPVGPD
jgi:ABC-type multidrug transport system fused ATPase/permease subunit